MDINKIDTKGIAFWITNAILIALSIFILSTTQIIYNFNTLKFVLSIILINVTANRIYETAKMISNDFIKRGD